MIPLNEQLKYLKLSYFQMHFEALASIPLIIPPDHLHIERYNIQRHDGCL